jgi:hypothetical protein
MEPSEIHALANVVHQTNIGTSMDVFADLLLLEIQLLKLVNVLSMKS